MKDKITCLYCESNKVKERSGIYGERPVASEMNHASSGNLL